MKAKSPARLMAVMVVSAMAMLEPLAGFSEQPAIGEFESHGDIGGPKIAGSAAYDSATQDYAIEGSGGNMWFKQDQFHFVWKQIKGDFIVQTRAEFLGKGVEPHRKMGWIARTSLDPDSAYADAAVHGEGLCSLQVRRSRGAVTEQFKQPVSGADVIQLERRGDTFIYSAARFGEPFTSVQVTNLDLGESLYVGLFVCSHNSNVVEKAVFHDVRVTRPAKADFVPYRDFIGSRLEILDVRTGRRLVLQALRQPFEAPNWTRDGRALIYNVSGRSEGWGELRRYDLNSGESVPINTGRALKSNNDHVLSFDGTLLGISHQGATGSGDSVISVIPSTGGAARLTVASGPSYLHGWSPDGKFLVYTARRGGDFNIYRVSSSGGKEVRLTNGKGLDDGPEYAPDGRHIYFNSARTGRMQLWRMKPDGSGQEQVTNDEFNNWFPHISPDGKWIVFLSFGADVAPTDHPYYRHVYLRLVPLDGGTPKVIAYIYGGQGTVNVPSWAPDSARLAFVSNTAFE